MSPLVKFVLDKLVKPEVDSVLAQLQANEAENVAQIEALVAAGGTTAAAAVENFVKQKIGGNAVIAAAEALFAPEINGFLAGLTSAGTADVPTLYAQVVAWLAKEDSYL